MRNAGRSGLGRGRDSAADTIRRAGCRSGGVSGAQGRYSMPQDQQVDALAPPSRVSWGQYLHDLVQEHVHHEADMLWIVITYAPGTAHKPHLTTTDSDLRAHGVFRRDRRL